MLDSEQIGKLRQTMNTSGWRDVIAPKIIERGRLFQKMMLGFASKRPEPYNEAGDEFLKGVIHDIEWMLVYWENEIAAHDMNQRRDELARTRANGEPVA